MGGDEIPTAIYSENILMHGYPLITKTYDMPYFEGIGTYKADFGLSYYILALFYLIFGISDFISRFPFAIFGVLTIVSFYYFCKYFFRNKKKAFLCSLLLLSNYLFLTSVRQARYYSMVYFLTILLVFSYLKMLDGKGKFIFLPFVISNIIFFYMHVQLWFYVGFVIVLHFFIFKFNKRIFSRLAANTVLSILAMVPWLIYWIFFLKGFSKASYIFGPLRIIFNFVLIYYYYFVIYFPITLLILLVFVTSLRKVIIKKKFSFVFTMIFGLSIIYPLIAHNAAPQVRKLIITLPFFTILIFSIFYHLYHKNKSWKTASIILLILFLTTNALAVFPLYPIKFLNLEQKIPFPVKYYSGFVDRSLNLRFETLAYFYETYSDYQSLDEGIIAGFEKEGILNCKCNVITDMTGFNLNYHFIKRGLPQRFYDFEKHKGNVSEFEVIMINFEDNKEELVSMFNNTLNISEYNHFIIDDYLETAWIDGISPINRRIKKSDKGQIDVCYKKSLFEGKVS